MNAKAILALGVLALPASADFLPLHGFVVHLDPYVFGPVAAGPPQGEIIAPFAAGLPHVGADGLTAADGWHWQDEFDILGFAGPAGLWVNGVFQGIVQFGPGTDFIVDFHQRDTPGIPGNGPIPGLAPGNTCLTLGFAEQGPVCKQLVNLTPFFVGHGVAVEECRDGFPGGCDPPLPQIDDILIVEADDGPQNQLVLRFATDPNGDPAFFVEKVPEPGTGVLLATGIALLWLRRRIAPH
jgi:hypothetical protein